MLLSTTTDLTAAQIKDLVAHPVQLAPAPGPGKTIVPIAILITTKFGTTPYTVPPGANFIIRTDAAPFDTYFTLDASAPLTAIIDWTNQTTYQLLATYRADTDNHPIVLANDSGTDYSLGDGTLTATLYYTIATT